VINNSAADWPISLSLVQSLITWRPIYNKRSRSRGQRSRGQRQGHSVMYNDGENVLVFAFSVRIFSIDCQERLICKMTYLLSVERQTNSVRTHRETPVER